MLRALNLLEHVQAYNYYDCKPLLFYIGFGNEIGKAIGNKTKLPPVMQEVGFRSLLSRIKKPNVSVFSTHKYPLF